MDFYWIALSIGLLSSFHCLGMCGPIALATPYAQAGVSHKWKYVLAYNVGRIATYMTIGLLFGLFGQGLSIA
ncbi:MAG: sulfite exporter TauE/SafE family protein, partial [Bacteroidetes bacterium]